MRNDWNTTFPRNLSGITAEADAMADKGIDAHTVVIILNGQHGGWDVKIEATTADMEDVSFDYILGNYGSLEAVK